MLQIVYFMFLILFCYVILVRLPVTPPPQEIILIIFVFTLFTEEVRQVCTNVTFFIYFPHYIQRLTCLHCSVFRLL